MSVSSVKSFHYGFHVHDLDPWIMFEPLHGLPGPGDFSSGRFIDHVPFFPPFSEVSSFSVAGFAVVVSMALRFLSVKYRKNRA